jgi:hypothetical protein
VEDVGVGEHGVMRMLNDDWNDALVMFWGQRTLKETVAKGESVLNSAMAAWVFDYYARMLAYAGEDAAPIAHVRQKAEEQPQSGARPVDRQMAAAGLARPHRGMAGRKGLWLEPQPWAIVGGVTDAEQTKELIATMDDCCGAILRSARCR